MTINATAVWRSRPSGNNLNGGGCDCSISPAATGTHGSFAGTTFTDATAAAFTSGMAGSALNIQGVGQYLITAFINASNVTLGSGGPPPLSGGATWLVSAGQDYSQQNAAQASGSAGTATGTTTFIDATANAFTAAMPGNCIQIASGTGFTPGFYFVVSWSSASTVVLDRSPGTGTAAVWKLGGGWADFWTNTTSSGPLVPGNRVYILGSGTPNPSSYTYDYAPTVFNPAPGDATNGNVIFENDPATPGYKRWPDTTGGMPVIQLPALDESVFAGEDYISLFGLYGVGQHDNGSLLSGSNNGVGLQFEGCVLDQFGFDATLYLQSNAQSQCAIEACEVFSSVAPGSTGANGAVTIFGNFSSVQITINGCNFHDTVGLGIILSSGTNESGQTIYGTITGTIVAKCRSTGIYIYSGAGGSGNGGLAAFSILNTTIDGNLGHGIEWDNASPQGVSVKNLIISNHTQSGAYGQKFDAGTSLQNDTVTPLMDYNVYYNNATDLLNKSYGPHDTHGGSNPYVGQPTENYTLA